MRPGIGWNASCAVGDLVSSRHAIIDSSYMHPPHPPTSPPPNLVSEPDPWKIEKEGLVNEVGWKCTLRNVRRLLIVEPSVASWAFWRTRHVQKCSNLTRLVLQHSKTNQNAKTALVQLAFLINAHQNANQKPIGSAPAYRAQCTSTPADLPDPPFQFSRVWFRD